MKGKRKSEVSRRQGSSGGPAVRKDTDAEQDEENEAPKSRELHLIHIICVTQKSKSSQSILKPTPFLFSWALEDKCSDKLDLGS